MPLIEIKGIFLKGLLTICHILVSIFPVDSLHQNLSIIDARKNTVIFYSNYRLLYIDYIM